MVIFEGQTSLRCDDWLQEPTQPESLNIISYLTPEWAHIQPITLSTQQLREGLEEWLLFYLWYDVSEVRTWRLRVNLERVDIVGVPCFMWTLLLVANSFCSCGTFLRYQNTGDLGHHLLLVPFCLVAVESSWWLSPNGALCSRPPSGESALCIVPGLERIFHSFKALPEPSLMLIVRINYYTFPHSCSYSIVAYGFSRYSFHFILWVAIGGVVTLTKEAPS